MARNNFPPSGIICVPFPLNFAGLFNACKAVCTRENKLSQVILRVSTEEDDFDGANFSLHFSRSVCLRPRLLETYTFLFMQSYCKCA
jgi:hypothetical protein